MVGNIGNNSTASLMQRPDPSRLASKLFSQLDTKSQGFIEKLDLQSAFDQLSRSSNSANSVTVDEALKQLDGDGDGKITKQEMTDSLARMAEQLESQLNGMRAQIGMPPPQIAHSQAGLTQEELQNRIDAIGGSTDSKRAALMTNILNNFDKADTSGDGKVNMQEAMAFNKASQASSDSSSGNANNESHIMRRIMQLVHAYGSLTQNTSQSGSTGALSTSA